MWDIILLVAASMFGIVWLLLPAEDEIRAFFDWDK
jgi:hypothetical protein